jgi:hypothetical protein
MSKFILAIAVAFMSAVLIATPIVFQMEDAAALTKAEQAQLDAAIKKTNMAVQKVQGSKAFMDAVKAKDAATIKSILIKNGAPDSIAEIKFDGPNTPAQRIKIVVSGSCCPPMLIIVIRF